MPIAKKKRNIIVFIVIIIFAFGYYQYKKSMFQGQGAGGMPPQMGGAAPVNIAEVIKKDVQQWNEFTGRLAATDRVEIRPRVSGVVESVNFTNGAFVNKGDLLFTIDSKIYQAEVDKAAAAQASANAQAILAAGELARAERLYKDKAMPQREYDERKNANNVANANYKSATASLETAKINLQYTQIKSPISGRVSRAEITSGNLVEAGANAPVMTTVVSINPIYADFEVDEDTYLQYAKSANPEKAQSNKIPVTLSLGDGANASTLNGVVESFDNSLNTSSGTIRVRAVFDNADGKLLPGLFVRIKLGSASAISAILITDKAVGTDQNKKFVFVVGGDNKLQYREITLGGVVDGLRVVKSGLAEGEKIVVNGLQRVRPGAQIQPEIVPMEDSHEDKKPL